MTKFPKCDIIYTTKKEREKTKMSIIHKTLAELSQTPVFINEADPLRFSAPKEEGLYLISNTLFNPYTNERIYLVKVGSSGNLYQRMRTYRTMNPCMFHIGYDTTKQLSELLCHLILYTNAIGVAENTDEWIRVTEETYFEICSKGFEYFYEIKSKKGLTNPIIYDII